MAKHRQHSAGIRLRPVGPADLPGERPQLPLYHHPLIAVSLILLAASIVQIGVWLATERLRPAPWQSTPLLVHGLGFEWLMAALNGRSDPPVVTRPVFTSMLAIAMLSGLAWFTAARRALGPPWGLFVGLVWVAHPAFAFLAQRSHPYLIFVTLLPVAWGLLLRWDRRRRRWMAAILGAALGAMALVSFLGIALLPVILTSMLLSPRTRKRWSGMGLTLLLFVVTAAPLASWLARPGQRQTLAATIDFELRKSVLEGDDALPGTSRPQSAPATQPAERPSAIPEIAAAVRNAPFASAGWYARRFVRTIYATADNRLQLSLLAMQLAFLVPGLWGLLVSLAYPRWRWMSMTTVAISALLWLVAAAVEPLARNLTPVGGFAVLFAIVGIADVYERTFGRRLIAAPSGARPQDPSARAPRPHRRTRR